MKSSFWESLVLYPFFLDSLSLTSRFQLQRDVRMSVWIAYIRHQLIKYLASKSTLSLSTSAYPSANSIKKPSLSSFSSIQSMLSSSLTEKMSGLLGWLLTNSDLSIHSLRVSKMDEYAIGTLGCRIQCLPILGNMGEPQNVEMLF
jgi:hypothetical protein